MERERKVSIKKVTPGNVKNIRMGLFSIEKPQQKPSKPETIEIIGGSSNGECENVKKVFSEEQKPV